MVFSGPEGIAAICNHVAKTVENGAEGESEAQGGNVQDSGSGGGGEQGDWSGNGNESDESGATSYSSRAGVLGVSVVTCCLAAYWL